ncbi:MFS transporter [Bifidobacterium gallicum]|nr:MFS transporter [Bifidobacterium gallicum]EFA22971.1 transporter, major facilitator family protein [Bifidobacterium gallicum DSM 20093 = LMG 11596]
MFALPGAKAFSASAALARLPLSMMSLGIVLALNHLYNNWTVAGAMSGAYILAVAAVTPLYARLFDRFGQRRVGSVVLAVQVVVMCAFAIAALMRVPIPLLFVLAIIMGGTQFSFGALVRTRWAYLLERTDNEDLLDTAYAFEAAVDEVIYIFGPILAASLATGVHPVSQLFVPTAAAAIGGTIFFAQRSTQPPVLHAVVATPELVAADDPELRLARGEFDGNKAADTFFTQRRTRPSQSATRKQVRNVLLYVGILPLCFTFLIFNMSFTAFDVSITAWMELHHLDAFLGVQLAMLAAGSLIGALVFGSHAHRGSHWRRMVICLALLALGFVGMRLTMDNFAVLGITELLAGLVVAPLLATGNLIIKDTVPDSQLTEGLSWLTTANAVGSSFGSIVAGIVVDKFDAYSGVMVTWIVVAASIPFAIIGWIIVANKNRTDLALRQD